MFNRLIAWSLHNRLLALAFTLFVCLGGFYALEKMPVDVFPEFAPPQVAIQTEAPGMSPQEVESLITYPLETAINGTPGVVHVRSRTSVGLSTIIVVFDEKTDIYLDRQLLNERIQQVMGRLPKNAKAPVMMPTTSSVGWLVKYALTSDKVSPQELRTLADWEIRPRLLSLGGIASVLAIGGEVKQYQVLLDPTRMLAYNITAEQVRQALEKSNINVPGAFLDKQGEEFIIGAIGRVTTLGDLKNTVITTRNDIPITISNVAEVKFGGEIKRGEGAFNLDNAVIGTISKAYGEDTMITTSKVEKALAEIQAQLPAGVKLNTQVFRQANFIETAVHNLRMALLEGAIIVVIILFVFLMNWRASFITFLSIPVSFLGGIMVMHAFGIGINAMTLGGLAIAIGEVVDDGIITVENVVRRLRLNRLLEKPLPTIEIIFDAVLEIRSSVVYATLIICLVFVPIFFLQGVAGRIFSPLGVAYVASVMASLVVSITMVPALCYMLLVRPDEKLKDKDVRLHGMSTKELLRSTTPAAGHSEEEQETRFVLWLKGHFVKVLQLSLQHVKWVVLSATLAFVFALALLPFFGRTFLPEFHEGNFIITMNTLPGTSLDESMRLGKIVRRELLKFPQVVSISQRAGRSELDEDAMPPYFSEFDVRLDFNKNKKMPPEELLKEIRHQLSEIPGTAFNVGQFIAHRMDEVLSGVRSQVAIKIFGDKLSTLNELGTSINDLLKTIPGAVDINKEQQINVPHINIKIDRDKAARYGINVGDITSDVEIFLNGTVVSNILEERRSFDLVIRFAEKARNSVQAIQEILIDAPSLKSKIPLRAVADVKVEDEPYNISRENAQRLIVVGFNVEGRDLGTVIKEVQARIQKEIKLPAGYYLEYGGQFETQAQANRTLFNFGCIILLVTLLLLYKVFGTFREALLVMLNIPLSFIGGVISLFLAGANMSVAAAIGFITLFGIAMRNGIILVTHYNQLHREGKPLQQVVIEGTLDRLVPVIMTAATAALGLIPLLLGSPAGKELQRPLAEVLLGGLFTSTLLNLIVVPSIYYAIERRRNEKTGTLRK